MVFAMIVMYIHRWRNPVRIVGELMSMRWAGQFETRGYLVEYAHFVCSAAVSIIANSIVGHPLETLLVPLTQNIMSTCIILRTDGCIMGVPPYRFVSYQNCVGALPPQVKYCGGACPPCPPPVPPPMTYSVLSRSISHVCIYSIYTV